MTNNVFNSKKTECGNKIQCHVDNCFTHSSSSYMYHGQIHVASGLEFHILL